MNTASALAMVLAFAVPVHAEEAAAQPGEPAAAQEQAIRLTAVEVTPQPMVYFSARSSMDSQEILRVMNAAFETLGKFIGEAQVTPLGPPLAVYSNWTEGAMTIDVGFPVSAADAAKAKGDILAGNTPGGHAIKYVLVGPYESLTATYNAIEAQMEKDGIAPSALAWEVYVGDPETTPAAELITEIYMQISAEDAAKLQAK